MICNHCLQKPKVPNNMLINKLKGVYESLINKVHEIILLGDLNIDMLKKNNWIQNELCDIYDLDNLISESTFFKRPEGTLIDPIYVRNAMRFKKSIHVFRGYSDWHHMVECITKLQIPLSKSHKVTYRSLKYFDENTFR